MMISRRSNKKLGNDYEKEVCDLLSLNGYWVHRINEDKTGAQPFDVIAVKNKIAYAIDCKTLNDGERWFPLSRLEDNQVFAFERWLERKNTMPMIFVKYKGQTIIIDYNVLKEQKKVRIDETVDRQGYTNSRLW